MRSADGHIKIVDFGLARTTTGSTERCTTLTRAGSLLGTPGYMAPEQLRGEPLDARADIFAFGVMAYELATGTHPFGGSDPAALIERMVSDTPPLSDPLNFPALDAIVRRCLQSAPANRYADGAELHDALRGALLSETVSAPAPSTTLWWWRFHQIAVAVLCAAVLAPLWLSRGWTGPWGSAVFLGARGGRDRHYRAAIASLVRVACRSGRVSPTAIACVAVGDRPRGAPGRSADQRRDCDLRTSRSDRGVARRHRPRSGGLDCRD